MKICYDQIKYVKGKRVYRIMDMIPGRLYIFEDIRFEQVFLAKVNNLEHSATMWGIDYCIVDAWKYRLNVHDFRLWEYMLEQPKREEIDTHSVEAYEATEPYFTCRACGSHELPHQVQTLYLYMKGTRHEQRIGGSSNYGRCSQCGLLQRHVIDTGYPTKWESDQAWISHPYKTNCFIPKPAEKQCKRYRS